MPKPGWKAVTVSDKLYETISALARDLEISRAEVIVRALEALDHHDQWGTVRIGETVVVCRVGSLQWKRGSYRVIAAGGKKSAEKSLIERVQYLTSARR
jgi:hypothetical protein